MTRPKDINDYSYTWKRQLAFSDPWNYGDVSEVIAEIDDKYPYESAVVSFVKDPTVQLEFGKAIIEESYIVIQNLYKDWKDRQYG